MEETPSASAAPENLVTDGAINLDAISQSLGPFDPPADFDHGDEFDPAIPRPIPGRLRKGSFGRRRWSTVLTLLVLGIGAVIFAPIPFVHRLSFHILPLAYLNYIGYGLIALAAFIGIRNRVSKARYNYVRDGEPLVGRVLAVFTPSRTVIDPQTKAVSEFFRYLVAFESEDPETRKMERLSVLSEDEWDAKKQGQFDPGVDAGDYVTLVRLPEAGPESTRLYGFLGLDPERDFITRNGRPLSGVSPFTAVLISLAVLLGIWFLILGIYVIECCMPSEWDWKVGIPFLAVGGVLGAIGLGWLISLEQRKQGAPKKSAVIVGGFFGIIAGALAGGVVMGSINAAFDRTVVSYKPIRINQHWMTTHNFIIRTYEVEYAELGGGKSTKHGVSVEDLEKLRDADLGALEIRQGALGLEWIAALHPMEWRSVSENPTPEELRDAVAPVPLFAFLAPPPDRIVPRLITNLAGDSVPCPPALADAAINDLKAVAAGKGVKLERVHKE